jgi:hypothetical protein
VFTIPARFNGPPTTANGGYACGVFAGLGTARHGPHLAVTLLAPPPLDAALEFRPGARRSQVRCGEELIATVTAAPGSPERLDPVSVESAAAASLGYRGEPDHPFRTCFVCGVDRTQGDGLLLAPGPLPGRSGTVACVWTPDHTVTGSDGTADAAVVWSVLDCPGGWTADPGKEPMVLSRMTARIAELPVAGQRYVVVGRRLRRAGRTAVNATALYTEDGRLLAHASAVWAAVNDTTTPGGSYVHT